MLPGQKSGCNFSLGLDTNQRDPLLDNFTQGDSMSRQTVVWIFLTLPLLSRRCAGRSGGHDFWDCPRFQ
jgi:hypothetical protein